VENQENLRSAPHNGESALRATLNQLYGADADDLSERVEILSERHRNGPTGGWSEQDAWLITYPDQFQSGDTAPLQVLEQVYLRHLADKLNGVHILPCYPWTSDDGYAVTDYLEIDPDFGTWADVEQLATGTRLMLDAVINHMSASSGWFTSFLADDPEFAGFFRTASPEADLAATVRPRATPLLTEFEGRTGSKWVWTTFSADQVDLDFRNPKVFEAVANVLFEYARHGAQMIRLDAVQFLGKQEGTTSINLPEAHLVVEALRGALDLAYPGVLLVSESNVPHEENLAYLSDAERRKAQIVYQFALAPLVLHTMVTGDATALQEWAAGLPDKAPGTSVVNYLASHDGVAVRPVENILSSEDVDRIVRHTESAGGGINVRALAGGGTSPYELASTWFDLMAAGYDEQTARARHLASHAIMLALRGIPLVYVHSLFGTANDHRLAEKTGMARSLNRHKFTDVSLLERELDDPTSRAAHCLNGLSALLAQRRTNPAFHPDVGQRVLETDPRLFGVQRGTGARIYVNVTGSELPMDADGWSTADGTAPTTIGPWESLWLIPG
jgi:sucrose phosphorylase